jgi:hypothetical protein
MSWRTQHTKSDPKSMRVVPLCTWGVHIHYTKQDVTSQARQSTLLGESSSHRAPCPVKLLSTLKTFWPFLFKRVALENKQLTLLDETSSRRLPCLVNIAFNSGHYRAPSCQARDTTKQATSTSRRGIFAWVALPCKYICQHRTFRVPFCQARDIARQARFN